MARARALAVTQWTAHITAATVDTPWRVTCAWIEDRDGAVCAELTNIDTGTVRAFRFSQTDTIAACRAWINE
jgi:hypothetical protein